MLLTKTDKARDELRPGARTLSQRERALLLMADGRRSVSEFGPLFDNSPAEARRVAIALVEQGYLHAAAAQQQQQPQQSRQPPAPAQQEQQTPPSPDPLQVASSADTFDGKRSLATTRMFLFDMCERMFVRRDPALAAQLRHALREARDRETMLAVATQILDEVSRTAGAERAESLRERIDRLLPPEIVH